MLKKVLILMLICTITATVFSACSQTEAPASTGSQATDATNSTDPTTTEPPATEPSETESPELLAENGILCLTFDDRNFTDWLNAIPLFEKYDAHATFFFSGTIDVQAISVMKQLQEAGHTIGLHTINHTDALPFYYQNGMEAYFEQEIAPSLAICQENGINVTAFAYPNNARDKETDAFLHQYFKRLRGGDHDGPTKKQLYIPMDMVPDSYVMRGTGLGELYATREADVLANMEYIAKNNVCYTYFSHGIHDNAVFVDMTPQLLESMLKKAQELGIKVMGLAELDP